MHLSTKEKAQGPSRFAFGLFEADLSSGELWKSGRPIRLQAQPFKVLATLLMHAGKVVSREELQLTLWGTEVVVDFEHSLGSAVKKLRQALGDSADNPRFIETLSRRGYRFIAPVTEIEAPSSQNALSRTVTPIRPAPEEESGQDEPTIPLGQSNQNNLQIVRRAPNRYFSWVVKFIFPLSGLVLGLLLVIASIEVLRPKPLGVTKELPRVFQVTQGGRIYTPGDLKIDALPAAGIDGDRLFTSVVENGKVQIEQLYVPTGESRIVPTSTSLVLPEVRDISRDGTKLLVLDYASGTTQRPLWVVPVDGGSAFRASNLLVQDATWMPDGKSILVASGQRLAISSLDGEDSTEIATVPGQPFWLRWSPDGTMLRFTVSNPANHRTSLWQLRRGSHTAAPVLKDWAPDSEECCGIWTPDGRSFVFQVMRGGHSDLWALPESGGLKPVQITNAALNDEAPVPGIDRGRIFFLGCSRRSELQSFDTGKSSPAGAWDFLAKARRVRYSADGLWVAWTDSTDNLWRARSDGTDKIRLNPDSVRVKDADWSPDGQRLALTTHQADGSSRVLSVAAAGGALQQIGQPLEASGPSFSPDGSKLVLVQRAGSTGDSHLEIVDFETGHNLEVSRSRNMTLPRWSPDGRYIAALTSDHKTALYDVSARNWQAPMDGSVTDLAWSRNGKSLFLEIRSGAAWSIVRRPISGGRVDTVVSRNDPSTLYQLAGITPQDAILVQAETSLADFYTLDVKSN